MDPSNRNPVVKPGDTIEGRYKIIKVLDEGGMGTVWLAEHVLIKRRVAIKILHSKYAQDVEVIDRFMNEARAAGTLGHPNIVESTDMGFTRDDVPYIVFEYLEGTLLTEEIYRHKGGLPPRRALKIAEQIASALQAAHNAGIVHRDLKSDNVFLTFKDEIQDHVKVLDFGISRFLEAEADSRPGQLMGTPEFMAPEQITDPNSVDKRADIWALGVIMYEMLSAKRPFRNDNDPHAVLHAVIHDPPPPLVCPRAPVGLAEMIIDKLLAKDREKRYPSMKEAQGALEAFHGILRRDTHPSIPPYAQGAQPGFVPPTPTGELAPLPPAAKVVDLPAQKKSSKIALLLAAVVAGGAGGAMLVLDKPKEAIATEQPTLAALQNDADKIATALETEAKSTRQRVEGWAQAPTLRAAIETDAATLRDVIKSEFNLKLTPGQVVEFYQTRDGKTASMVRVPEGAAEIPLPSGDETRVEVHGQDVAVVVGTPIELQRGGVGGTIAMVSPIDMAPIRQRAAAHAQAVSLVGLASPVVLAGSPDVAGKPVSVPVAVPKDLKIEVQLAAKIAPPPELAPPDKTFTFARYGLWGLAGLLLLIYVASLLRGRPSS